MKTKCISKNCNNFVKDGEFKVPPIFCLEHSKRHAMIDYLCDICSKNIRQRNDVISMKYRNNKLIYCAQCSRKISPFLNFKEFENKLYSDNQFKIKFLDKINGSLKECIHFVFEYEELKVCAANVALINSNILFKGSKLFDKKLALNAFLNDIDNGATIVFNKLMEIDEEFEKMQNDQRRKSFEHRKNSSWQKCIKAGTSYESRIKQEATRRKNNVQFYNKEWRDKNLKEVYDKTVRNKEWMKIYGLGGIKNNALNILKELSENKDWIAAHPNFHTANFTEKDGVVLYKGVPWEEVKKKFLSSIPKPLEYWANEFGGVIQPTFRVNKYNWEGKTAFEQSLLDNNIAWFVYIKFFISKNDNTIVPLVVGKTGSLLVNDSGSDISFDYKNENDNRPARLFIEENNNVDWYKNFIVIIPCSTENDALMLEYNIKMKYNLFNS